MFMEGVHSPQDKTPIQWDRLLLPYSKQYNGTHFINLGRMNGWVNFGADLREFELGIFGLVFQQRNY